MFPDQMEFAARERQQMLLQSVEERRLRQTSAAQQPDQGPIIQSIRCWLGAQLVAWGYQLQGYRLAARPPLPEQSRITVHYK